MRWLTDYYDNDSLYYIMDAVLIGGVGAYMYYYSEKTIVSKTSLVLILILAVNQIINVFYMLYQTVSYINYLPYFTGTVVILDVYRSLQERINKLFED